MRKPDGKDTQVAIFRAYGSDVDCESWYGMGGNIIHCDTPENATLWADALQVTNERMYRYIVLGEEVHGDDPLPLTDADAPPEDFDACS